MKRVTMSEYQQTSKKINLRRFVYFYGRRREQYTYVAELHTTPPKDRETEMAVHGDTDRLVLADGERHLKLLLFHNVGSDLKSFSLLEIFNYYATMLAHT